jgi:HEAT repeat protein
MESDDSEMRFEAATAAGALGDEEALSSLARLALDEDAEVQEAAIGAIGEIGGPAARAVLHEIAEHTRDERVLEAVTEALSQADFVDDPLGITMHLERSLAEDMDEEDWEAADFETDE